MVTMQPKENYHGHHDLSLATLHVHLDDDNCMEVTALRGSGAEVQHFADHIIAERGVKYGRVVMIPTEAGKKPGARKRGAHHLRCGYPFGADQGGKLGGGREGEVVGGHAVSSGSIRCQASKKSGGV